MTTLDKIRERQAEQQDLGADLVEFVTNLDCPTIDLRDPRRPPSDN